MLHWFETLKINVRFLVWVPQRQGKCIKISAEADEAAAIVFLILLIAPLAERTLQLQILWTLRKILQATSSQNNTIKSTEWWYMTEGWKSSTAIYFHFIFISFVPCVISLFLSLTASCCGFFRSQKPYACQIPGCTKRYTDPSSLRKHVKAHSAKGLQEREVKVPTANSFFLIF